MADIPLRISAFSDQKTLLPNPSSGYKIAIDKVGTAPASGIDITAIHGGFSSLRTVDEYYAVGPWNLRFAPQYIPAGHTTPGTTLTEIGIPTSVDGSPLGNIIAIQAVSVLDNRGMLHDAHGMHDDCFNRIPFYATINSGRDLSIKSGATSNSSIAISGIEGRSLNISCAFDTTANKIYLWHNYATVNIQTQNPPVSLAGPNNPMSSNGVNDIIGPIANNSLSTGTDPVTNGQLQGMYATGMLAQYEALYANRMQYFEGAIVHIKITRMLL